MDCVQPAAAFSGLACWAKTRQKAAAVQGRGRLSSGDADLAVHEHREEPVAEGGEFLVLGAETFDEVEEGSGGLVELLDEIRVRKRDGLGRDDFGVHGWVGSAAG